MQKKDLDRDISTLLTWYDENRRDLPWRHSRDPYAIWISETMLQQTTTTAVIPYFERFLQKFPNIKSLAAAHESEVLELWAGLGYYSRAKNLHKAAQQLAKLKKFPARFVDLLPYPGFGPYTAMAVSSIAFDEPVGVLDGNVIRVLTRRYDLNWPWWQTKYRNRLQELADQLARVGSARLINQALMELGSQICVPKNPRCLVCPLLSSCAARRQKTINRRPQTRPKRAREIWVWNAEVDIKREMVMLVKNSSLPFLSSHWVLPGNAHRKNTPPRRFLFKHSITHHDIFVNLKVKTSNIKNREALRVKTNEVARHAPSSLIKKALGFAFKNNILSVLTLLLSSLLFLGCRTSTPQMKNQEILVPQNPAANESYPLTAISENYRPRISSDGSRLLFLSEKRTNHTQPQVYEMNLKTRVERRVTFQDGAIYDANYTNSDDVIIYSSNTDEIKENPIYIRQALQKYKPQSTATTPNALPLKNTTLATADSDKKDDGLQSKNFFSGYFNGDVPLTDIYIGGKDGRDIKRLTNANGFEGEIAYRPKHNEAVIVFNQRGLLQLGLLNVRMGGYLPLISDKAAADKSIEWPNFSRDGKQLVWMRENGPAESEIWLSDGHAGNAKKILGSAGAIYTWPRWTPSGDEIVFSSNKDDHKKFSLYVAKADGSCLRRITTSSNANSANEGEPIFAPDSKTLYFTSDRNSARQIYFMVYSAPPCPVEATQVR